MSFAYFAVSDFMNADYRFGWKAASTGLVRNIPERESYLPLNSGFCLARKG